MLYIYTQNSLFGRSEKERFLDRFWIGFRIDFGEVLERFFERFWIGFGLNFQ